MKYAVAALIATSFLFLTPSVFAKPCKKNCKPHGEIIDLMGSDEFGYQDLGELIQNEGAKLKNRKILVCFSNCANENDFARFDGTKVHGYVCDEQKSNQDIFVVGNSIQIRKINAEKSPAICIEGKIVGQHSLDEPVIEVLKIVK